MKDRFRIVLVLILLGGGIAWAGFGFNFVCRDDTVRQIEPGGIAEFHFTLTNTASVPDIFRLDSRVLESVPGWVVVVCAHGRCVEPGSPLFDTLAPGESDSTIDVTVYAGSRQGVQRVNLKVTSLGDTMLTDSITVVTRTGSGVFETVQPAVGVWVSRSTVVHSVVTIHWSDGACLVDGVGRRLRWLTPGVNSLRGVAPGVYLLIRPKSAGTQKVILR